MTSPTFGFIFNQLDDDVLPPILSDFSSLWLVLPSDDANPAVFPLDTGIDVNTGDPAFLAAAGTGPLYKALRRINAQLGDLQRSARCAVVRVAMAKNPDGTENVPGTIENIVGDPGLRTGMYALLLVPSRLGFTPRIGGSPGYTGLVSYGVTAPVITAQGAGYANPVVTFTPPGATATATVGNAGVPATAHAVLGAGAASDKLAGVALDNGGQNYGTAVPAVAFAGGGIGTQGVTAPTAHAVLTGGVVTSVVVDTAGAGLTGAPTVTIAAPAGGQITAINLTSPGDYAPGAAVTMAITDGQGGAGTGAAATVSLEMLANKVVAAAPPIANALKAHFVAGGPGGTKGDAIAWRATINSQRVIPVDNWEIVDFGQGNEYFDGAAAAMGCGVRVDFGHGGYPFWSWANVPIQGTLGLKRVDALSLLDGATDGEELLDIGVGVTARGDLQDTSIDDSGFVLVCYRNATSDPLYYMLNKTRGRDFTDIAIIKSCRHRLGRDNITLHDVQAVLNDLTAIFTDIKAREGVLGFKIRFDRDANTPENLRLGKIRVYAGSEEPAPITQITIDRALDRDAVLATLAQIAAGTDQIIG